ncbi:MAG: ATP-binding protein [bacterium]|nr:ATP-binding protein [bacterium]
MFGRMKSIRWKLSLSYILVALFSFLCAAFLVVPLFGTCFNNQLQTGLVRQAALVADLTARPDADLKALVAGTGKQLAARITVVDAGGRVRADSLADPVSMDNHGNRPEIKQALQGRTGRSRRYSRTLGRDMLYVALPLRQDGRITGAVRLALPAADIRSAQHHIRAILLGSLLLSSILGILLGFIFARSIVRPLHQIGAASRELAAGNFRAPLDISTGDELQQLAEAFKSMGAQLAKLVAQLSLERDQMGTILENMADGIVVVDENGRVELINAAAIRILASKTPADGLKGGHFVTLASNYELAGMLHQTQQEGGRLSRELELLHPAGTQVSAYFSPVSGPGGDGRTVIVLHDITRLKRLESVRQVFVANVSHELRTPLASIKAMVETILGSGRGDARLVDRFLGNINQEIDRLNNLIADLLQLSRIEDAGVVMQREEVDAALLIGETLEQFASKAAELNIDLQSNTGDNLRLRGDAARLKQVLLNLIDNALKFTPAGGQVTVSAGRKDDRVVIRVADTGTGIPQADMDRIFERFYRVDKARSRTLGGTGLGLSIVKHIVESHDGSISVDSREGHGSVFTVSLPAI